MGPREFRLVCHNDVEHAAVQAAIEGGRAVPMELVESGGILTTRTGDHEFADGKELADLFGKLQRGKL